MGIDTCGRLLGRVKHEEILNFIKQRYDVNAKSDIKMHNYGSLDGRDFVKERYDTSNEWLVWYGRIDFKDVEDNRSLFYDYSNINSYENLEFYSKHGLEDMVKSETTFIDLNCWGNSVDIIKSIVEHFGGWIDENDCDDKEYYPIIKNDDGTIKQVVYVTMEDIYKKFDNSVVIIVDKH